MQPKLAWISFGILVFVYIFGQFNYFTNRQFLVPGYTVPWRSIFSRIQEEANPEAIVICSHGDYSCFYYSSKFGYGRNSPTDWSRISEVAPQELWWIQTNLGTESAIAGQDREVFEDVDQAFQFSHVFGYSEQDPSIRWIKENFFI